MKKFLLFPALFVAITSQAQTKLTLRTQPHISVAIVRTDFKNYAFQEDPTLIAAREDEGEGYFSTTRGFFQFDLSSIPKSSFINWAKLNLYGFYNDYYPNSGSDSFLLCRVTSPWEPLQVTWNTQPTTSKRGMVRLPMSTSREQDYKNIIVNNLVQIMVDSPETSFGFAIRLISDMHGPSRRITFSSPENGLPRDDSKLVLEYTAPGMQPAVTTVSVNVSGASTQMTIYPNPCNKSFNCNIKSASADNMTLRIIDVLGRTVYSQPVHTSNLQFQVNLPSSSAGTYFVILQDSKCATLVSQQLQVN